MNNPPEPYDREKHEAWFGSLSPDELLVVHTPQGYRIMFILVALTKRALLTKGIKPAEQLDLLEKMHSLTDQYFTPEMLAMIDPMGDVEYSIYQEAKTLDSPGDKAAMGSFRMLTSCRVFWMFVTANPSMLDAIKFHEATRNGTVPPVSAAIAAGQRVEVRP